MFKHPYNFDADVASFQTGLDLSGAFERTQQNFADEVDINTLVKTFARTGIVPGQEIPAMIFEVDEIIDYQTALNRIREADDAFMALPAVVRDKFQNDPAVLLDFVGNSENREAAIELGLIPKPVDTGVLEEPGSVKSPPAAPVSDS